MPLPIPTSEQSEMLAGLQSPLMICRNRRNSAYPPKFRIFNRASHHAIAIIAISIIRYCSPICPADLSIPARFVALPCAAARWTIVTLMVCKHARRTWQDKHANEECNACRTLQDLQDSPRSLSLYGDTMCHSPPAELLGSCIFFLQNCRVRLMDDLPKCQ